MCNHFMPQRDNRKMGKSPPSSHDHIVRVDPGSATTFIGGYLSTNRLHGIIPAMPKFFPETSRWRSIEQVCHTIKSKSLCFDLSSGLDIALQTNVPLVFLEL